MDASFRTSLTEDKQSKRTLPTASHTSNPSNSPLTSPPQHPQQHDRGDDKRNDESSEINRKDDDDDDEVISVNSSLATNDAFEENCIQILGTPHESTTRRLSSTRWNRLQTRELVDKKEENGLVFDRLYRHAVYKMELDRMPGEWKEERPENLISMHDVSANTTGQSPRTTGPTSSDWKTVIDLETSVSHRLEHAKSVFTPSLKKSSLQRTTAATPLSASSKVLERPKRKSRKLLHGQPTPRRSPNTRYKQYSAAIVIQTWWRKCPHRSVMVVNRSSANSSPFLRARTTNHPLSYHRVAYSVDSYTIQQEAAIIVQSWWRMTIMQDDYRTLQWAVHTIQRYARQSRWNQAARSIQAYFRGYKVRQDFGWLRVSVILIQSVIRMFLIRCKIVDYYQLLQQRSLLVQYKRVMLQRNLLVQKRAVLRSRRTASVLIQTQWRRYQAMGMLESLRACCIIVQSQMRGYLVRKSLYSTLQMKREAVQIRHASAVSIQAQWRRYLAVEKFIFWKQVELQNHRTAVVLIQTQWRSYLATRMYRLVMHMRQQSQQRAALVIQTKWRGYLALGRYDMIQQLHAHNQERAAVVIQSQWRKYLASRVYKMILSLKRQRQERLAVKIQAQWRRYASIRLLDILKQVEIQNQHMAATYLQALWRRHAASRILFALKLEIQQTAVVTIQSGWRRYQAIEMFECLKACIIIIQAQIRGYLVRRSIPRIIYTMPTFKHYQGVLVAGFDIAKAASVNIQRVARGYLKRQKVNKFRSWLTASVSIQTKWRSFHAVKTFQVWRACAILIQSHVRRHLAQCMLATSPPGFVEFKSVLVNGFDRSNIACTQVQRVVRGYLVRHNFDLLQAGALQRILFRHDIIMSFPETYRWQCYWRIICVRHQFNLHSIEHHALRLQCWWRMVPIQHHLQNLQILSVWLQAIIRGYLCRNAVKRMTAAATIIQTSFRSWQSARDFAFLLWAASTVQNWWRRHRAATLIQSAFRMWTYSPKRKSRQESTIILQKSVRRMLAEITLITSRLAVLTIQSTYRGYKLRYHLNYSRNAATRIQAGVRSWLALHHYHSFRVSLIALQSYARRWIMMSRYARSLQNKRINDTAIRIQRFARCGLSRRRYLNMRTSIILLQSHVRAWLVRDFYVCIKYELSRTITLIQSLVRSWLATQKYLMIRTSAIILQSWVRGSVTRHKFQKLLLDTQQKRVTKMQAIARRCLAVQVTSRRRAAVIHIQSRVRTSIAQQVSRKTKFSVVKLQSHYRGWVERNKYTNLLTGIAMQRQAAFAIQRAWRKFYRKTKYPHFMRAHPTELSSKWHPHTRVLAFLEQTVAATTVQNWFRCCHTRNAYKSFRRALVLIQTKFRFNSFAQTMSVLFLQRITRGISCRRKILAVRKNEEDQLLKSVLQVQILLRNCFLCTSFLGDDAVTVDLQQAVRRFEERRQSLRCDMLASVVTKQYVNWKLDAWSFVLESAIILLQLRVQGIESSIPALVSLRLIRERLCLKTLINDTEPESHHDSLSAVRSSRLNRAFSSLENSCCVMIQRLYRGYQARIDYEALRIVSKEDGKRRLSRSASWSVRVLEQLSDQRIRVEMSVDKHLVSRHNAACVIQTAFLAWREHRLQICIAVLRSLGKVKIYRNVYGEMSNGLQLDATPYLSDERVREAHMDFGTPDAMERMNTTCVTENRLRVQLMDALLVAVPFMTPLN